MRVFSRYFVVFSCLATEVAQLDFFEKNVQKLCIKRLKMHKYKNFCIKKFLTFRRFFTNFAFAFHFIYGFCKFLSDFCVSFLIDC